MGPKGRMSQRDQKNGDSHPARPFTPLNNVTLQDTRWFAVFPTPAEGIYCGFWITRDGNWPVGTAHTPKALRLCIWNFRSRIGPRRRWRCDRRLRSGRGGECSDGLRLQNPAQAETPFSMATQILLGAISGPLHILVCLPYLVLLPFSCTLVGLPPLLAELLLLQVEVGLADTGDEIASINALAKITLFILFSFLKLSALRSLGPKVERPKRQSRL